MPTFELRSLTADSTLAGATSEMELGGLGRVSLALPVRWTGGAKDLSAPRPPGESGHRGRPAVKVPAELYPSELSATTLNCRFLPYPKTVSSATLGLCAGSRYRVGGMRMTTSEEQRVCPHCGFRDVPTLVVRSAAADGGISWRCHSCHESWTDRQYRLLRAS